MEHFFSPNSSRDLLSDAHQSQIIGGNADEDQTKNYWGDTAKLLGGIYPPIPPGFRHPCQEQYAIGQQQSMLRSTTTKTNFNFSIFENF